MNVVINVRVVLHVERDKIYTENIIHSCLYFLLLAKSTFPFQLCSFLQTQPETFSRSSGIEDLPSGRQSGGKWSKSDNMESSINCEQNGNGIWSDLFIWLTHTTQYRYLGEITKLKERMDERLCGKYVCWGKL